MPHCRVQEIVTNVKTDNEENIINEEKILQILKKYKSIKRYSYVLHDKDVYTEEDEKKNPEHKAGTHKADHYHIAMEFDRANDTADVSRWFGIPENFIKMWRGQGAFMDAIMYQTHEHPNQQAKGKHLYPDEEIHTNFEFRKEMEEREEQRLKTGRRLSKRDKMRYEVLYEGKTLRQCMQEDPIQYMNDMDKLKKLRMENIYRQKPPVTRINYYVEGRGGVGKGMICRAIARSLFPQYEEDEDIFFEVGAKGVAFEGYDGQPVIIWNDRRAIDLLQELDGRGNVFNVFETHPTKQKQNIKYGSINLCNKVNIVNSVQNYVEFLDGLAGEYKDKDGNLQEVEDKGQSYRRFPFMIILHEEDYDMMLNKGFMENTRNYEEYIVYERIRGNMQRIAERCGVNKQLAQKLESQVVQPIVEQHQSVIEQIEHQTEDEEKIKAEFADYGTQKENPETTQKDTVEEEKGIPKEEIVRQLIKDNKLSQELLKQIYDAYEMPKDWYMDEDEMFK